MQRWTLAKAIQLRFDIQTQNPHLHSLILFQVVLRSWYEKNKHIYPSSRWEPFVPGKVYKRTIDDLSTI
jgi:hypothetical protein